MTSLDSVILYHTLIEQYIDQGYPGDITHFKQQPDMEAAWPGKPQTRHSRKLNLPERVMRKPLYSYHSAQEFFMLLDGSCISIEARV